MASVTVPLASEPVLVDLSAPGAWRALYRRELVSWARLATGRDFDVISAQSLARDACRAFLAAS
ncbi:MAG TPA: hypothetical protein VNR19_11155 [Microbacterium sp.]|nr:hypothetical protein [Microbacterium sp.]